MYIFWAFSFVFASVFESLFVQTHLNVDTTIRMHTDLSSIHILIHIIFNSLYKSNLYIVDLRIWILCNKMYSGIKHDPYFQYLDEAIENRDGDGHNFAPQILRRT